MRKLRHRGFKQPVQGHIANKVLTINALTHYAK